LTVHHLDNDKTNTAKWNLAALCQRCHLHMMGKVHWTEQYMLEHPEWMKSHVEAYFKVSTRA
jgi:5-methylcytosine-specific restriction endonuclease McrA